MNLLTVKEVAELKAVSVRHVQRLINSGEMYAQEHKNPANNRRQYLVPLNSLSNELQQKFFRQLKNNPSTRDLLMANQTRGFRPIKRFDELSTSERDIIAFWIRTLKSWKEYRNQFAKKTDADPLFVDIIRSKRTDINISINILYRKWAAYKIGDIESLLDHRGGWNRGQCGIPKEAWNWFLTAYLDERQLSISQCYELTKYWVKEFCPEIIGLIPSERTFRRQVEKLALPVVTMGRKGVKAYSDRCAPYIVRLYDDLCPNDYWIADNHTLDIISRCEDGSDINHRLSLTAFMDARSGVIVGWNLTNTPCSQSTVLALRHAILRFGLPKVCYFDNGSEFLTHDLAGRGHRSRKSQNLINNPPTIFARLGVELKNALVNNAKAKPIERTFCTFKGQISRLFETFCGGNLAERPESLKSILKSGKVPFDGQLRLMISDFIDGIYNVGAYGGPISADKGKQRIDVWNEYIREQRRATEDDLSLLLMRSSRQQTVGRNGVFITVCNEKLYYWDDNTWRLQGKVVYVRYDPSALETVRIYEADSDRYITTIPMATSTMLRFHADRNAIHLAQTDIHRVKKEVKAQLTALTTSVPAARSIDMLDLSLRRAQAGKKGMLIQSPKVIVPLIPGEALLQGNMVQNTAGIVIDMKKMNNNAANRRKS